jgi:hypothetical protein
LLMQSLTTTYTCSDSNMMVLCLARHAI